MAHFVEHMIFMGSKKYPRENEYDSVINKSGGENNASTDVEQTCFYFEVPMSALNKTLDVFTNLLYEPLFCEQSMDREMSAIDSEFDQAKQADHIRCEEVLAQFANEKGPHARFSWGSKETLKQLSLPDMQRRLREFWEKHYSAHRMSLAIQANMALDDLEKLVQEHFDKLKCDESAQRVPYLVDYKSAFKDSFAGNVIYVEAVDNKIELNLMYTLPSQVSEFKCKPAHFMDHLLNYEGSGGLIKRLKQENLAQSVATGVSDNGFETNSIYTIFHISIKLSNHGYKNIKQVLANVSGYLRLLQRNVDQLEPIYRNLQLVYETQFRYISEPDMLEHVQDLSIRMKHMPDEHLLDCNDLLFEYDENLVRGMIDALNDTKRRGILLCTQKPMEYDLVEHHTKAKYKVEPLPADWHATEDDLDFDYFHLPLPNRFITTDFTLVHNAESLPGAMTAVPRKLHSDPIYELWYKEDVKFALPKVSVAVQLLLPIIGQSLKNTVLMDVFVKMLHRQLLECLEGAPTAGYSCEIGNKDTGIVVRINGFSEKFNLILEQILKCIDTFAEFATPDLFGSIKEEMLCTYVNTLLSVEALNNELRLSLIEENYWSACDKYEQLRSVTVEDVLLFYPKIFEEMRLKCLVQGNIDEAGARMIVTRILDQLKSKHVRDPSSIQSRSLIIPQVEPHTIRIRGFNKDDINSALCQYYQLGREDLKQDCMLQLILMIMEEPLFDQLRTQKQLGYEVSNQIKSNNGLLGFTVTIISQETKHSLDEVQEAVNRFLLEDFMKILEKTDESDFKDNKDSLIELKKVPDQHLYEEADRNWGEIQYGTYKFNRQEQEIAILAECTKAEVVQFYKDIMDAKARRTLCIQVQGSNEEPAAKKKAGGECATENAKPNNKLDFDVPPPASGSVITDIAKFKRACPKHSRDLE